MSVLPSYNALVASASILPANRATTPKYDDWQQQLWNYYDSIGEFEYGVGWLAKMLSRVRLVVAELDPNGGEPIPLEGPAADVLARLAGGTGGQAAMMSEFTVHLTVPGECWLLGEQDPGTRVEIWSVKSADELKVASRRINGENVYQVRESDGEGPGAWRLVAPDSLVVRCWRSHPRWGWKPDSPGRHALSALFEIDVVNKRIIATLMSRLASNGILLYDKTRLSIPSRVNPAGPDEVDPFAQILVDVAGRGIADPASPEATIPIPIGYQIDDLQNVDPKTLMQLITLGNPLDDKLLAQRESAVRRLATSMDLPAEVLLGMGDVNHWGQAQIMDEAVKVHIVPIAEIIVHSLTVGYLLPMLEAVGLDTTGPNGGRIVVWYDPSEITTRPDKSANVLQAYDRLEATGDALRREVGLDESDAPLGPELQAQALKVLLRTNPTLAASALATLGGPTLEQQAALGQPAARQITINRPPPPSDNPDAAPVPSTAPDDTAPSEVPVGG